jgi:aminoglycoside phosphotransferase (APT) family kinase protein
MARVALVPEWSPEIVVDEALARRLLAEQFPELRAAELRLAGEGWDNTAWLVDGEWLFRFPRREIALDGVRRELAVLPRLAPLLPLPVPRPLFVGEPGDAFPWPFFGGPVVPGRELAEADLDDEARAALAPSLGRFLRALHAAELEVELPVDPLGRADMPFRVARARERLAELGRAPDGTDDVLEAAVALPPPERLALVHGDLHLRHVFVQAGRLSGVIDWGDVCRADPAIDLVLVWGALPPAARPGFFAEYGEVPEDGLLRARVLSIFLAAVLALHARHEGLEHVERESLAALERTLAQ